MDKRLEEEDKRICKLVENLEFDEENRIIWNMLFNGDNQTTHSNRSESNLINNQNKNNDNSPKIWTQINDDKSDK